MTSSPLKWIWTFGRQSVAVTDESITIDLAVRAHQFPFRGEASGIPRLSMARPSAPELRAF